MKITTEDGQQFELVIPLGQNANEEPYYALKPVKKTEKYIYQIIVTSIDKLPIYTSKLELELTEPTANKLSEAISALVEFVTTQEKYNVYAEEEVNKKMDAARESYEESQ